MALSLSPRNQSQARWTPPSQDDWPVIRNALEGLPERRESLRLLLEFAYLQAGQTVQQIGLHARLCLDGDASLQHVCQRPCVAQAREESVEALFAEERTRSHQYGGRSVFGTEPPSGETARRLRERTE